MGSINRTLQGPRAIAAGPSMPKSALSGYQLPALACTYLYFISECSVQKVMADSAATLALAGDHGVFQCASPSDTFRSRRLTAAAEAERQPQEQHTWTAGDWVVGRNAKAEFALTNSDLSSIDVRCVGGGILDIRRPKKYYSRADLRRLSEQKHGAHGIANRIAKKTLTSPLRMTRSRVNKSPHKSPRDAKQASNC